MLRNGPEELVQMKQLAYLFGYRKRWLTRRERREVIVAFWFLCLGCSAVVVAILYLNGQIAPRGSYESLMRLSGMN